MKAIKIVGLILILLAGVALATIYLLPDSCHMERKTFINRPPADVYRELVSFKTFATWSPWFVGSTDLEARVTGAPFGVGARYSWSSTDPDLGNGYTEIIEVVENEKVVSLMKFDEYESEPTATFHLTQMGTGTEVVWTYDESGVQGLSKIFILGIDGFLSEDYESGLQALKERIESAPRFSYAISLVNTEPFLYLGIEGTSLSDPAMSSTRMAQDFGSLMAYLGGHMIEADGPPFAVYQPSERGELSFICGVPIQEVEKSLPEGIAPYQMAGYATMKLEYQGGYADMGRAYDEMMNFATYYGYELAGNPWEVYVTDPEAEPDSSKWFTQIHYPVQ